jgi:ribonuclease-3
MSQDEKLASSGFTNGGNADVSQPAGDLEALETNLAVRFQDRRLLWQAVTHHSARVTDSMLESYDRLEFLGDALIGVAVVEHLYHAYPQASEGELTAIKSEVVSRRVLARLGLELGLIDHIRVDVASLRTFNERSRESLCADALEAIVGAIHLDQGRAAAARFIARIILPVVSQVKDTLRDQNPKGDLQQHVLRQTGQLPRYELLAELGESNDRRYVVGVYAVDTLLARGEGHSIKEAGREAARAALRGDSQTEEGPPSAAT